ncbi:MAG: hypothetical protein BWZ05_02060 [Bacteroidetes bacterium ADurb.BinA245]|nr:MAG: hypothetical protein BWZ05_02060 [Bacteroidetes bacterium ADurb.BinA245]
MKEKIDNFLTGVVKCTFILIPFLILGMVWIDPVLFGKILATDAAVILLLCFFSVSK